MSNESKQYSYSTDGENYSGPFSSIEAACEEAASIVGVGSSFYIGENKDPIQPEKCWHAEDWLEQVSCQDEYSLECAEDWDSSSNEQRNELEVAVRSVLSEWLDRHGLRPRFWVVTKTQLYTVTDDIDGEYKVELATTEKK